MRDNILEYLNKETSLLEVECEFATDGLMSLLAPIIEKARKWDEYQESLKPKPYDNHEGWHGNSDLKPYFTDTVEEADS